MTPTQTRAKKLRTEAAFWRRAAQSRTMKRTMQGSMASQLARLCDALATEMLLREALEGLVKGMRT